MSLAQEAQPPMIDRKQHLTSLKDRLEKYKLKNQLLAQKESEIEAERLEKERLEKEREELRIEAEKQALILELQRVSPAKPSTPKPKPKPAAAAPTTQTPPPPQPQQQQAQQAFFPSFGYPANVTEKEAIDWLRSGF